MVNTAKIDICICFTRHFHYLFKEYIIHICCLQSFEPELCMLNCIVRRDTVKSHFKAPLVSSYKPCYLLKQIILTTLARDIQCESLLRMRQSVIQCKRYPDINPKPYNEELMFPGIQRCATPDTKNH